MYLTKDVQNLFRDSYTILLKEEDITNVCGWKTRYHTDANQLSPRLSQILYTVNVVS